MICRHQFEHTTTRSKPSPKTIFEKGRWYHVIGTYDGKKMKLYVNGVEEATGIAANGNIAYPEKAYYTIGAYRDADEFFRMQGVVHRVRVYNNALDSTEIKKLSAKGKSIFPKVQRLAWMEVSRLTASIVGDQTPISGSPLMSCFGARLIPRVSTCCGKIRILR